MLAFGHRIGFLPVDVGALLRLPAVRSRLAERILDEAATQRLFALEPGARNRAMLRLLYAGGLRRSELVGLRWRDLQPREDAGQVTVLGKGGKTRAVLLPAAVWRELAALRGAAGPDDPVFRSRAGGPLDPSQVLRIVKAAAARAGIAGNVSPHWLRHGHASHALDRGAPVHLVAATLGHASIATTGRYAHARPSDSSSRCLAVSTGLRGRRPGAQDRGKPGGASTPGGSTLPVSTRTAAQEVTGDATHHDHPARHPSRGVRALLHRQGPGEPRRQRADRDVGRRGSTGNRALKKALRSRRAHRSARAPMNRRR